MYAQSRKEEEKKQLNTPIYFANAYRRKKLVVPNN